jgi:dTDP-glucose 4,6-dehydratase
VQNILITGGAGFIGSNFVQHALQVSKTTESNDLKIINLDALTYAGNLQNLDKVCDDPRYTFIKGDIRDRALLNQVFLRHDIDTVVHFAAESHVDRSIETPQDFLEVNVMGTQSLLEAALRAWRLEPENKYCREYRPGVKFLQVSTDEVYGSLKPDDPAFTEAHPLAANSPYSASKASADLFVRAYGETYGLPVNITRCSNNYGPYQFPEKLIPLMINNALQDLALPVYGDGLQVRDWLYVDDHCSALWTVLKAALPGAVYNIGGNNEQHNIDIIKHILRVLGKPQSLIQHIPDRPGHDRRYAIDNTRLTQELGWQPKYRFEQGISETVQWYLDNRAWVQAITSGDYQKYYQQMYG